MPNNLGHFYLNIVQNFSLFLKILCDIYNLYIYPDFTRKSRKQKKVNKRNK